MSTKRPSRKRSSNSGQPPEGKMLSVKNHWDGLSVVKVDNGVPHTISILTRTEVLGDLLSSDLTEIRAHLMTRHPGHFRSKK
jgi:hypothetical protein